MYIYIKLLWELNQVTDASQDVCVIISLFQKSLTHDGFSVDGGWVVVSGGGRMEAIDFAAVERIVLWGQRQGVTLLEKGYKQLHKNIHHSKRKKN